MALLVRAVRCGERLLRRLGLGCVVGVAAVAAVGCGAASHPPAPTTSTLRLAPGLRVIRSVAGLSDIDSGSGRHYRYMIVGGPRHARPAGLLTSEVRLLRRHDWRLERPITVVDNGNHTTTVGPTHHGAVVVLDGPHDVYVALQFLSDMHDLNQAVELNPGGQVGPLGREIRSGVPMLSATLGHQND
jgi:hypothetical protein